MNNNFLYTYILIYIFIFNFYACVLTNKYLSPICRDTEPTVAIPGVDSNINT